MNASYMWENRLSKYLPHIVTNFFVRCSFSFPFVFSTWYMRVYFSNSKNKKKNHTLILYVICCYQLSFWEHFYVENVSELDDLSYLHSVVKYSGGFFRLYAVGVMQVRLWKFACLYLQRDAVPVAKIRINAEVFEQS